MRETFSRLNGRVSSITSLEAAVREFIQMRNGLRMAQQALRREQDQRFADRLVVRAAAHLPAQHVEILRRGGADAHLHIVFGAQLQEPFDAGAGMLRPLAFVAVRQQQHQTATAAPTSFPPTKGTGR